MIALLKQKSKITIERKARVTYEISGEPQENQGQKTRGREKTCSKLIDYK